MKSHCLIIVLMFLCSEAALAKPDLQRGRDLMKDCLACHSTQPGDNKIGPSLFKIFGRKAGVESGFRYSPALKGSGLTWTKKNLDEFIADPQKKIPGNRMPYSGMAQAKNRADVILFLMSLVDQSK